MTDDLRTDDFVVPAAPTPGFEADAVAMARRLFGALGKVDPRMAVVDAGGGHRETLSVPCYAGRRDVVIEALRLALAHFGAVGVAVISEAWLARSEGPRDALPANLSTYAGREEVLFVAVEHRAIDGGATRCWRASITRDAAGVPTLGPFLLTAGGETSGRMVGLLPAMEGGARA
jgi:hypothetical protein